MHRVPQFSLALSLFPSWFIPSPHPQSRQPSGFTHEQQLDFLCFHLENARHHLTRHARAGAEVDKWVVIMNVERFSIFNTPSVSVCTAVMKVLLSRFPEHLGHMIVWQAPSLFWGLWYALRGLLDDNTRKKIVFVSGDDDKKVGSPVDRQMRTLLGDDWRRLTDADYNAYDAAAFEAQLRADEPTIRANALDDPAARLP